MRVRGVRWVVMSTQTRQRASCCRVTCVTPSVPAWVSPGQGYSGVQTTENARTMHSVATADGQRARPFSKILARVRLRNPQTNKTNIAFCLWGISFPPPEISVSPVWQLLKVVREITTAKPAAHICGRFSQAHRARSGSRNGDEEPVLLCPLPLRRGPLRLTIRTQTTERSRRGFVGRAASRRNSACVVSPLGPRRPARPETAGGRYELGVIDPLGRVWSGGCPSSSSTCNHSPTRLHPHPRRTKHALSR